MRRHRSFDPLRVSLLTALGLAAAACGSNVETDGSAGGAAGHGGNGGNGGNGGAGGSGAGPAVLCEGATQVMAADGSYSGFDRCPDGTIHRVQPVTCDPTINAPACAGTEPQLDCTTDADCTAGPHGKCAHFDAEFENPDPSCRCVYSCSVDADCQGSGVCVCNGVVETGKDWAQCAGHAACTTNAGCASGVCGLTSFDNGCWYSVELACRAAGDACRVDADCPEDGAECVTVNGSATWSCETQDCAIGRPLLVGGEARTAPAEARGDWAASLRPDVEGPDAATRAALAAHWEAVAALEHASIASFARFTLELLALGAPPDLLLAAQRAGADEIEHARVAYALAAAYGGRPRGPGPLDLTGVTLAAAPCEILRGLIEEACVGETLGAAEALAIADVVEAPALREVHARIAEDERAHAELGWRALRWMLEGAGEETRRFAADVFERAMQAAARDPGAGGGAVARRHGLLSAAEIGALRRQALSEVVRPCARALLGGAGADQNSTSRALPERSIVS